MYAFFFFLIKLMFMFATQYQNRLYIIIIKIELISGRKENLPSDKKSEQTNEHESFTRRKEAYAKIKKFCYSTRFVNYKSLLQNPGASTLPA